MRLKAKLIYNEGQLVDELSVNQEPPLLGGDAILDDEGVASFKLRITVLSSLCHGRHFRIQVNAIDHPDLLVRSEPMKTLTKLKRNPVLKSKGRGLPHDAADPLREGKLTVCGKHELELEPILLEGGDALGRGLVADELWSEVLSNSLLLIELQHQQRKLFAELRELRELRQKCEGPQMSRLFAGCGPGQETS